MRTWRVVCSLADTNPDTNPHQLSSRCLGGAGPPEAARWAGYAQLMTHAVDLGFGVRWEWASGEVEWFDTSGPLEVARMAGPTAVGTASCTIRGPMARSAEGPSALGGLGQASALRSRPGGQSGP